MSLNPLTFRQRPTTVSPELLQKPDIPMKDQLQIVEVVLQHRNAIYAHSKRKAGDFFGIVTVVLHKLEYVRVNHAAAENFYPSGLLARATRVSPPLAASSANEAGDEHLCARLGKWKKRWPETGLHV